MVKERYEKLAKEILDASIEVHRKLGPGLLESVYSLALVKELELRNVNVKSQVRVSLFYKEFELGKEYVIDQLVEDEIILEIKSCEEGLRAVHQAQLLSYLKLSNKKMGFLINFNVPLLKDGFRRMVNNYRV